MKLKFNLSVVCFGVFWTMLTLAADGFLGHTMAMRLLAMGFSAAPGTVTYSQLRESRPDEGGQMHYNAELQFRFSLGERTFESKDYQFGGGFTGGSKKARRLVKQYPVGKQVTVYYHPEDPTRAVLHRGFDGGELFLLVFLAPCNAVMVAFWGVALHRRWRRRVFAMPLGAEPSARGGRIVLPLSACPPVVVGAAVAGVIGFMLSLGVGVVTGMEPGLIASSVSAGLVVAGGALGYAKSKLREGWGDLTVDTQNQTLTLPVGFERKAPKRIPFAKIKAVEVEDVVVTLEDGVPRTTYAAALLLADSRRERLEEWRDPADAAELVQWVAARLGLPTPVAKN